MKISLGIGMVALATWGLVQNARAESPVLQLKTHYEVDYRRQRPEINTTCEIFSDKIRVSTLVQEISATTNKPTGLPISSVEERPFTLMGDVASMLEEAKKGPFHTQNRPSGNYPTDVEFKAGGEDSVILERWDRRSVSRNLTKAAVRLRELTAINCNSFL